MCTVTWLSEPGGYRLLCNRDELRSRRRAEPPRLHAAPPGEPGGLPFLAPVDGEAGGTWIAVNTAGCSLCLLNDYAAPSLDPRAGSVSRGRLVTSLAGLPRASAIAQRLAEMDLGPYRPFHLLVLEPGQPARVLRWNGRRADTGESDGPPILTSSSFDAAAADRERRSLLERWGEAPGGPSARELLAFHRSHEPVCGALSPCMHRPDARTVSFSEIRVGPDSVSFRYADGPPCEATALDRGSLARRGRINV